MLHSDRVWRLRPPRSVSIVFVIYVIVYIKRFISRCHLAVEIILKVIIYK